MRPVQPIVFLVLLFALQGCLGPSSSPMRPHARTVIVLGGWILMLPPLDRHDPMGFNTDAPVAKWSQFRAYDSARECEEDHLRLAGEAADAGKALHSKQMTMGRCIPAEHIYPPKTHVQK